ncbi:MAG: hydroxymethylglutaryl-CoA lyase [Granulosicoccus sp.]|jgi:hydroxymethylglutaryl-CoA lyase
MANSVEIIEVSPRDGIQNEKKLLSLDTKLELINRAVNAGAARIEVTSFVNPRRVPQMAEADEVCAALPRDTGCQYIGLALNRRGFERACNAGLDEVNFVVVATDIFSGKNQGTDTDTGIALFNELARETPAPVRAGVTIGAAFGCPFEGEVSIKRLMHVVRGCMQANPFELALADTIGVATPPDITNCIAAIRAEFPEVPLRLHLHNTRNTGLANAWAGVQAGAASLDSSFGGVGGCPFAPAATGNVPTEDLVYMLERAGIDTGVDLDAAISAAKFIERALEKNVPGMIMKAGVFPQKAVTAA